MREDLRFRSGKALCAAWLYRGGEGDRPCVVMGHGFGGTRADGLAPFAERIAASGFHALVFDYRCFGDSEGEPRQLLSVRKQLEDWQAAIAFARGLGGVDAARIALWGSSFSGGHVVVAGARDGRVAAIVAQAPMMDGWAAARNVASYAGLGMIARSAGLGLADLLGSSLGLGPKRVPIVGPPGSFAAMATPDSAPGYQAIAGPNHVNEVCARIALGMPFYRPVRHAHRLPCPILIQIAARDSVAPAEAAERAAQRAGARATVLRYDVGHFDVYVGAAFERSVGDQIAFLTPHLARAECQGASSSPAVRPSR